jgi:F420 biosynthesis protein FbiB-like protein
LTSTTDLHTFLRTRRSVRRFKPNPVPDPVIENILHTATFAPSAHHRQPWRFVVISSPGVKVSLADAMAVEFERDLLGDGLAPDTVHKQVERSKKRITSAPSIVLLCLDMSELDPYPDTRRKKAEYTMAVQSVAAAGLQLLLAAHAEGLGGVWACWPLFAQNLVQKTLAIPASWEPQAMMFIGYPEGTTVLRERKSVQEIVLFR